MTSEEREAKKQKELAELALGLAHDPKTRKEFVNLIKKRDPNFRAADVEIEDLRDDVDQRFAARDQQEEARKATDRLSAQRRNLIDSGRFKEEDVVKIEKDVMEKYGLADYDAAAKLYAADMKPAGATPEIKTRVWEMPDLKSAMNDPAGQARSEAYKAIDEIKRKRA